MGRPKNRKVATEVTIERGQVYSCNSLTISEGSKSTLVGSLYSRRLTTEIKCVVKCGETQLSFNLMTELIV